MTSSSILLLPKRDLFARIQAANARLCLCIYITLISRAQSPTSKQIKKTQITLPSHATCLPLAPHMYFLHAPNSPSYVPPPPSTRCSVTKHPRQPRPALQGPPEAPPAAHVLLLGEITSRLSPGLAFTNSSAMTRAKPRGRLNLPPTLGPQARSCRSLSAWFIFAVGVQLGKAASRRRSRNLW